MHGVLLNLQLEIPNQPLSSRSTKALSHRPTMLKPPRRELLSRRLGIKARHRRNHELNDLLESCERMQHGLKRTRQVLAVPDFSVPENLTQDVPIFPKLTAPTTDQEESLPLPPVFTFNNICAGPTSRALTQTKRDFGASWQLAKQSAVGPTVLQPSCSMKLSTKHLRVRRAFVDSRGLRRSTEPARQPVFLIK